MSSYEVTAYPPRQCYNEATIRIDVVTNQSDLWVAPDVRVDVKLDGQTVGSKSYVGRASTNDSFQMVAPPAPATTCKVLVTVTNTGAMDAGLRYSKEYILELVNPKTGEKVDDAYDQKQVADPFDWEGLAGALKTTAIVTVVGGFAVGILYIFKEDIFKEKKE